MDTARTPQRSVRRIVCIQLGGEYPDFCYRMIMPDYGMPVIATVLAEAGYDVTTFVEHVQPPVWEIVAGADVVCMSTLSAGAAKTYALADRIRSELGVPVILGGTHATYFVADCLPHCDYVVLGEGDETILDLVDALRTGRDPSEVDGIAFLRDGSVHRTRPRLGPTQFDTVPDFSLIHGYRKLSVLDILRQRRLPLLTAQSSRGCHFHCTYCIVDTMFPRGYRKRNIEAVIRDLKDKRKYGKNLMWVDNDFAAVPRATKELLRRIIEEDLDYDFMVLTRTDVVRQDEVLELMRRAGVSRLYQGFESIEPETLKGYDKRQTVARLYESVKKLHAYGFRISGSFVIGADTDSLASVRAAADFVVDGKLSVSYFFPLWGHYPEQKNGNTTIVPQHRAIFKDWGHCDGNFVTHFPKQMRPSELQLAMIDAHDRVFATREIVDALRRRKFGDAHAKLHHRVWWEDVRKGLVEFVPWLQEIEHGLYDANGRLREDELLERYRRGPEWRFPVDVGNVGDVGERKKLPLAPVEQPIPVTNNIRCVPAKDTVEP
jgi:radical SAM superfamily enzyme YgiQ (UPF0313 family)